MNTYVHRMYLVCVTPRSQLSGGPVSYRGEIFSRSQTAPPIALGGLSCTLWPYPCTLLWGTVAVKVRNAVWITDQWSVVSGNINNIKTKQFYILAAHAARCSRLWNHYVLRSLLYYYAQAFYVLHPRSHTPTPTPPRPFPTSHWLLASTF
eukprot:scaffold120921_cov37-Tisochrysis_lutea.AAC.1